MARRDPGNKPAWRIGLGGAAALIVVIVLLVVFATRMAHPLSQEAGRPPASAR